jgi:hypothetical protein
MDETARTWADDRADTGGYEHIREGYGYRTVELAALRDAGLLRHVVAGVHVPADVEDSPTVRARACAAVRLPAGAALSHRSAAFVHAGGAPPPRVEVTVPRRGGGTRASPVVVHHGLPAPSDAADQDIVDVGGVAVTSPVRTAVDLARSLPEPDATALLAGWPAGLLDVPAALARLAATPRAPHVRRARRVLLAQARSAAQTSTPPEVTR